MKEIIQNEDQQGAGRPGSGYDALPTCVKTGISRKEYEWLPDAQKHTIMRDMCNPEPDAEDPAS